MEPNMIIKEKRKAIDNILRNNIDGCTKITSREESNLLVFKVEFGPKATSIELNKEYVIKTELSDIEATFKQEHLYKLVADINNPRITALGDNLNIMLNIGYSLGEWL